MISGLVPTTTEITCLKGKDDYLILLEMDDSDFVEVCVKCSVNECMERGVKGHQNYMVGRLSIAVDIVA